MKRHAKATEHDNQVAIFDWTLAAANRYPELRLLHAIPNGGSRIHRRTKKGTRYSPEGQRMRREGVAAGIPDIHLPVARGASHSLYIELKLPGKEPTPVQKAWIWSLQLAGNMVVVSYSAEDAIAILTWYIQLPAHKTEAA
jgi:hypothetical protein